MRKIILWLGFIGKVVSCLAHAFDPLLPAWDDLQTKLKEIAAREELLYNNELTDIEEPNTTQKGKPL